jgi:hypothetical protein
MAERALSNSLTLHYAPAWCSCGSDMHGREIYHIRLSLALILLRGFEIYGIWMSIEAKHLTCRLNDQCVDRSTLKDARPRFRGAVKLPYLLKSGSNRNHGLKL